MLLSFSVLQRKLWLQARHQIIRTAPNQLVNLSQLDCGEVLAKNTEYIQHFNTEFGRIVLSDPIDEVNLQMDCESIRKRNHFPTIADKESREYPLAYARIINTVRINKILIKEASSIAYSEHLIVLLKLCNSLIILCLLNFLISRGRNFGGIGSRD